LHAKRVTAQKPREKPDAYERTVYNNTVKDRGDEIRQLLREHKSARVEQVVDFLEHPGSGFSVNGIELPRSWPAEDEPAAPMPDDLRAYLAKAS
jgi:hypothetical protein